MRQPGAEDGGAVVVELAAADLHYPRSIEYESGGRMFVTEMSPNRIVEIVYDESHGGEY